MVLFNLLFLGFTVFAFWVVFMDGAERLDTVDRLMTLITLDLFPMDTIPAHRRIGVAITWLLVTGMYAFLLLDKST